MSSDVHPFVTIAIPTFNRADSFFPLSLASACSQSYPDLEIFISDNASHDNTRDKVEAMKDSRIRYHRHPENIGPSRNENFCVQEARGDYVVILPDDDLIDPDFIDSCVGLAAQNPAAGLIRTGTRIIDAQDRVIRESPNGATGLSFDDFVMAWIDGKTSPYQCSSMFRTVPFRSIGLHSRHYLFNDVVAHFKMAAAYGRLDLREPKASFRLHGESATDKASMRAWCEESMDLLHLLCELSPANRELIQTRGTRFLAGGNYRRALRKPFPKHLLACFTVFRTHNFIIPPRWVLDEALKKSWR